jgi:hypothetical protein
MLADMATDDGDAQLNRVTRDLTDLSYGASQGKPLTDDQKVVLDFYDTTIKPESQNFPVAAANLGAFLDTSKNLPDILSQAGYTPSEVRDVLNGTKSLDQIDNPTAQQNLTQTVQSRVTTQILQTTNVYEFRMENKNPDLATIHASMKKVDILLADKTNPYRARLTEYRQNLEATEKALEVEQLETAVKNARDYGSAITAVASLVGKSPDLQNAAKAYNAGLDVYSAVGRMLINGALDPSGISAIASGIGIVANLIGPKGPSADERMIGMLSDILKTQREIIQQLKSIEGKVDLLDHKLDSILAQLANIDETVRVGIVDLKNTMLTLARQQEEQNRINTETILNKLNFTDAETDLKKINDFAYYRQCIAAPKTQCSEGDTTIGDLF